MGKTKAIREAVEAELRVDPLVDATDITVRNMNGDVTFTGVVTELSEVPRDSRRCARRHRGEKCAQSPGGRAAAATTTVTTPC